jgi:hypothetical protein
MDKRKESALPTANSILVPLGDFVPTTKKSSPVMRAAFLLTSAIVSVIGYAGEQDVTRKPATAARPMAHDLSGSWSLRIENAKHQVVTTMTIRFSDEVADSCTEGQWRRVVVTAHASLNEKFFPVKEPLSYEVTDDHIVIGRNEICDDYLHLEGKLRNLLASGEYVTFGPDGSKRLGYFSLIKTAAEASAPPQVTVSYDAGTDLCSVSDSSSSSSVTMNCDKAKDYVRQHYPSAQPTVR